MKKSICRWTLRKPLIQFQHQLNLVKSTWKQYMIRFQSGELCLRIKLMSIPSL